MWEEPERRGCAEVNEGNGGESDARPVSTKIQGSSAVRWVYRLSGSNKSWLAIIHIFSARFAYRAIIVHLQPPHLNALECATVARQPRF